MSLITREYTLSLAKLINTIIMETIFLFFIFGWFNIVTRLKKLSKDKERKKYTEFRTIN